MSCTKTIENETLFIDYGEKEAVPWKWNLFFCFAIPEALVMFRSLRMLLSKTVNRPTLKDFVVVLTTETIHVFGLAILHLVALPNLDSVRIQLGYNFKLIINNWH